MTDLQATLIALEALDATIYRLFSALSAAEMKRDIIADMLRDTAPKALAQYEDRRHSKITVRRS